MGMLEASTIECFFFLIEAVLLLRLNRLDSLGKSSAEFLDVFSCVFSCGVCGGVGIVD